MVGKQRRSGELRNILVGRENATNRTSHILRVLDFLLHLSICPRIREGGDGIGAHHDCRVLAVRATREALVELLGKEGHERMKQP